MVYVHVLYTRGRGHQFGAKFNFLKEATGPRVPLS